MGLGGKLSIVSKITKILRLYYSTSIRLLYHHDITANQTKSFRYALALNVDVDVLSLLPMDSTAVSLQLIRIAYNYRQRS